MRERRWLLHLVRAFFFFLGFAVGPALSTLLFEPEASNRAHRPGYVPPMVSFSEWTDVRASFSEREEEPTPAPTVGSEKTSRATPLDKSQGNRAVD